MEEGGGALTVHPYWVVVSIIQFLLLFYLLRRYLWGPILGALQARADRIREGLEMVEAAKREREQMAVEVERLLGEARREASALSERVAKASVAAAADIRTQAKAEADRIRERAKADTEQLHAQSLAQLKSEVASMAVLAAGRILGKEVDADAHRSLIERSLDEAGTELGRAN